MRVYLDNAATTPVSKEVVEAMLPYLENHYGNPSSIHAMGREARAAIEKARKQVASQLGASIGEIFFTSCGTESNNMAIKCAVRDLGVQRIISSRIEHHCVLYSVERLEKEGVQVDWVQLDAFGRPDYADLERLLQEDKGKTLVSLMHANNEIGTLIDLEKVALMCQEHGALFHSDTVQTVGHFPIDLSKIPVSFISGSAHKFHGPKGVGFIYINGDNLIQPYIDGGAQERNMRAGTENIAGIMGLAKALELACEEMDSRRKHIEDLRKYLATQLKASFPEMTFNGDWQGDSLYTVLSVSFPPSPKADLLQLNLDIAGICVSGGSACSSGADAGSHVLTTLGAGADQKMIRFSFSHYNTREELDYVLKELKKTLPSEVKA